MGAPGGSGPTPRPSASPNGCWRPTLSGATPEQPAAHLLEVAPLHGAVLHLPEVHVAKVVCRLPLEGGVSARLRPPLTLPPAPSDPHAGWGLPGSHGPEGRQPLSRDISADTVVSGSGAREHPQACTGLCTPSHALAHTWSTGKAPGTLASPQKRWPTPSRGWGAGPGCGSWRPCWLGLARRLEGPLAPA